MTNNRRKWRDHFGREYFERWNYAGRKYHRFSMYGQARRYYASIVRRNAPARGGRLLEVGCGLGHLLGFLEPDFECFGVDVAEFCVHSTKQNSESARLCVGDANELGFLRDGSFDVIVALHLVEHLFDPAAVIRTLCGLLRPEGLLLLATPNPGYILRPLKSPEVDAIAKDRTHINVHSPAVWRRWCEDAGFRVERHFSDGLWDTPYLPWVPNVIQFPLFTLPAALQVATRGTWMPVSLGVNQVLQARRSRAAYGR